MEETEKSGSVQIVIIEREEKHLHQIQKILTEKNSFAFSVIHIKSFDECIRFLREKKADILFISLPHVNGSYKGYISFINTYSRELPIIALIDSKDDTFAGYEAVKAGARDFLVMDQPDPFLLLKTINLSLRSYPKNNHILADHMPDPVLKLDKDLKIIYMNSAAEKISGLRRNNWVGKKLEEVYSAQIISGITDENFKRVLKSGEKEITDFEVKSRGRKKYFELIIVPEKDEFMNEVFLLAIARDVTERVKSRDNSREQENLLNLIFDILPVGVWLADEKGNIVKTNKIGENIWGGAKYVPITGLEEYVAWWADTGERLKNEDWAIYRVLKKGETSINEILNIQCFDGTKKTILNSAVPFHSNDKKIKGVAVVNQDITGIKKMEQDLKASVAEKEILIKEIHHRVKNNLQIISSIFNLQMNYLGQKSIEEIFQESQSRIKSMALIHEKLYRSKSLISIDFKDYLKDLLVHLFNTYRTNSSIIRLETDLDELSFNSDTSVALGLVANELVVNSLKHAFPENQAGILRISLKDKSGTIHLNIKDNGIGLPPDFDYQNSNTLGMLLVDAMVSQLDGKIDFEVSGGTEIHIAFPKTR